MATKKGPFQANVGYVRLPSRTSEGSRADFNKVYTQSARQSMAAIINRVNAIFEGTKARLPGVLEDALAPTFELSQNYCPVKTGALKESGSLTSGVKNNKAFASISYGAGGKVHYAAIVHERTDMRHNFPTRSKYLQAALEEDLEGIRDRVVNSLRLGS